MNAGYFLLRLSINKHSVRQDKRTTIPGVIDTIHTTFSIPVLQTYLFIFIF